MARKTRHDWRMVLMARLVRECAGREWTDVEVQIVADALIAAEDHGAARAAEACRRWRRKVAYVLGLLVGRAERDLRFAAGTEFRHYMNGLVRPFLEETKHG